MSFYPEMVHQVRSALLNSTPTPPSPPAADSFRQSSHPDIESHANSMKTKAETFFNRHTFAFFVFTRHTPEADTAASP
jgi:hypothetical protein